MLRNPAIAGGDLFILDCETHAEECFLRKRPGNVQYTRTAKFPKCGWVYELVSTISSHAEKDAPWDIRRANKMEMVAIEVLACRAEGMVVDVGVVEMEATLVFFGQDSAMCPFSRQKKHPPSLINLARSPSVSLAIRVLLDFEGGFSVRFLKGERA